MHENKIGSCPMSLFYVVDSEHVTAILGFVLSGSMPWQFLSKNSNIIKKLNSFISSH